MENDKNMTECARSAAMLDGEISKYVDILQGVAQGCTLSPNLFPVVRVRATPKTEGVRGNHRPDRLQTL